MIRGVCCKGGKRLPAYVMQVKESITMIMEVQLKRRTTKAAVMIGDGHCKDLVAFSVYAIKAVQRISTGK